MNDASNPEPSEKELTAESRSCSNNNNNDQTIPTVEPTANKKRPRQDEEEKSSPSTTNTTGNDLNNDKKEHGDDTQPMKRSRNGSLEEEQDKPDVYDEINKNMQEEIIGSEDNADDTKSSNASPAVTRSRAGTTTTSTSNTNDDDSVEEKQQNDKDDETDDKDTTKKTQERWRVHQIAEDYVNFVGQMMYPATKFGPYGYNPESRQYPIEHISLLHYIKTPLRRPSVIEKWSPYEIAVFEGSIFHYGKEFHLISRQIKTKTTQEVIDFYYLWKKTKHYKKWKEQYVSDADLLEEEDHIESPVKKPGR